MTKISYTNKSVRDNNQGIIYKDGIITVTNKMGRIKTKKYLIRLMSII